MTPKVLLPLYIYKCFILIFVCAINLLLINQFMDKAEQNKLNQSTKKQIVSKTKDPTHRCVGNLTRTKRNMFKQRVKSLIKNLFQNLR